MLDLRIFFADKELFMRSGKSQMRDKGKEGYTNPEIYRIKKIIAKINQELQNDESQAICDKFSLILIDVCFLANFSHINLNE